MNRARPTSSAVIIVLNGAPRAGKSSIAAALQQRRPQWSLDGVDRDMAATPAPDQPGIGLRPGGERPDLERLVKERFKALYNRAVRQQDVGRSTVIDVGHHHDFASPIAPLWDAAELLADRRAWLVGVRCDLPTVLARRAASDPARYVQLSGDDVPDPVLRWQRRVHDPGIYDLTVDSAHTSTTEAANAILLHIATYPPLAFREVCELPRPR